MRAWFSTSTRTVPIGLLLIAMVSVQTGVAFAKGLFAHIGPQGAATLRLLIFVLVMTPLWRPWRLKFSKATILPLLGYGAALGVMNLTFYMALSTIPLGIAVALEFLGPLAVACLASRRAIDLAWVALAAVGITLLLPLQGLSASLNLAGVGFALAAGACWALYIVFGQKAGAEHGGGAVAFGGLVAALIVTPFGVAHAGWALLDPAILPTAAVVALLSSIIPYSCEMVGLTRLPARTFGILMSLEPAVAAVSGLVFLGEHLTLLQVLAILAVIAASLGTVLSGPSRKGDPTPAPAA
jgi:inner membrane transporter RhtA